MQADRARCSKAFLKQTCEVQLPHKRALFRAASIVLPHTTSQRQMKRATRLNIAVSDLHETVRLEGGFGLE
jgi:hypothetical protein